jgi:hypothetical protein
LSNLTTDALTIDSIRRRTPPIKSKSVALFAGAVAISRLSFYLTFETNAESDPSLYFLPPPPLTRRSAVRHVISTLGFMVANVELAPLVLDALTVVNLSTDAASFGAMLGQHYIFQALKGLHKVGGGGL